MRNIVTFARDMHDTLPPRPSLRAERPEHVSFEQVPEGVYEV